MDRFAVIATLFFAVSCARPAPRKAAPSSIVLRSAAFAEGQTMPDRTVLKGLDCDGANESPPVAWEGAVAGVRSWVLVMDDFEARGGDGFVHWAIYNIPAGVTNIPANAGAAEGDIAGIGRHAYNDFLKRSYGGPCPPEGPPHKYRFTVYAVDLPTIDDAGTPMTWRKLRFIIHDHILGQGSLTGLRGH
jgi:Raf kinase inhibitor-like YbhB/YbcL family protein